MILIVGKHFKGLREHLERNNIKQHLLCDEHVGETHAKKQGCDYTMASFASKESLAQVVTSLPEPVEAVVTIYENYVLPAAWLTEMLSANGLPVLSAEACTDKDLMRQLFAKAPEQISPDFTVVTSKEELEAFADTHSFPLVLKPANLVKSLLVTTCYTKDELLQTFETTSQEMHGIYKKYAPHREPKLIVEEYLKGAVHSVDAFVDGDGTPHVLDAIVDYRTGHDIGFNDNFHYSRVLPSALSADDQAALLHVAELGCKALGMKYSAAHIEIIMTEKGPRIVEIGARNGGYRARMHSVANGIDIYDQLINTLTDQPINASSSKRDGCAVLELFPKVAGEFTELASEDQLRKLPSFTYLSIKAKPGDRIGLSSAGHKATAVIILHNPDLKQFQADLAFVDNNVQVVTA